MVSGHEKAFDVVLVGGGLACGLAALALAARRPDLTVALVERGARVGGNHLWCFHDADVDARDADFIAGLPTHRFSGYDVHFPRLSRQVQSGYFAVPSHSLATRVEAAFSARHGWRLMTETEAVEVDGDTVRLANGSTLNAALVVDARGPDPSLTEAGDAFQKFVGVELKLSRPHGLTRPILMDARVPQTDGFRFVYVIPFARDRVLIEDTYFSSSPELDVSRVRNAAIEYAIQSGLRPDSVLREERGVLPLPLRPRISVQGGGPLPIGYSAGFFHPTTGYSFPIAARVAALIARLAPEVRGAEFDTFLSEHGRQLRFAGFLNRLLYGGFAPEEQRNVLERFYGLPEDTIARFYALNTTSRDRARILCGRPPRGLSLRRLLFRGANP